MLLIVAVVVIWTGYLTVLINFQPRVSNEHGMTLAMLEAAGISAPHRRRINAAKRSYSA